MSFAMKYFDGVRALEAQTPAASVRPTDPFDLDSLAAKGVFDRIFDGLKAEGAKLLFDFLWFINPICPRPRIPLRPALVLVMRDSDVRAVLKDSERFHTPFGDEMRQLAFGADFVLGLDGEPHCQSRKAIEAVWARTGDLEGLRVHAAAVAEALLDNAHGRIDVVGDYFRRIATETFSGYFGLELSEREAFADWTESMNYLLFADPLGNPSTRLMALTGSKRASQVVDPGIEQAKGEPPKSAIVSRMVAAQPQTAAVPDIRASVLGLATGFIPTVTLAAANVLQFLLQNKAAMRAAVAAVHEADTKGLKKVLLEAARLNPALQPGQWRIVVKDGHIGPAGWGRRKVKAGDVVLVATKYALRDPRVFSEPTRFQLDRPNPPDLMFGHGPHYCLGKSVALTLLTSMFMELLRKPNLRPARDSAGELTVIGPYPRRWDLEFGR
jgi:cytochrome P450